MLILSDAYKSPECADQEKVLAPAETVKKVGVALAGLSLDVLAHAQRVDTGRLDIPVYVSVCGKDARALTGTKKQMGKGSTPDQAHASAVMELVERFSLYAYSADPANFTFAPWEEVKDRALSLDAVARSVGDDPAGAQKALQAFAKVPQRWCRAYSLTRSQEVLVPFDWFFMLNQFNGSAAGNVMEEALTQGICEVVERHASALASLPGAEIPGIKPESVTLAPARELLEKYTAAGVLVHLQDMTMGMGVPTVGVLAYDPATLAAKKSEVVWTAGTAPDPQRALCRALTEAAQLGGDFETGSCYVASGLPKPASLEDAAHLLAPETWRSVGDLPDLSSPNMKEEIGALVAALDERGMEVLALDTTHPELAVSACYIMVPGALFRERAAAASTGLFTAKLMAETLPAADAAGRLLALDKALGGAYYTSFYLGTLPQKPAQALLFLDRALSRNPHPEDEVSIRIRRAMALKDLERFDEALEELSRADAMDPERTDALNLMGFCCYKLSRHEEAVTHFERVLALDPESAMDHANLGANYRELGDLETAARCFVRALELDPSITFAREELAKILKQAEG
ncbi:MAG: YcaO-like family protein [Deltaproteobacteria bacterium]|nr:YcaO-like family protein [Deltaproteobacteria bacterium]